MDVNTYLKKFYEFSWLWSDDKDRQYAKFVSTKPTLEQYEARLLDFERVVHRIKAINSVNVIGALSINTSMVKNNLTYEVTQWKLTFSAFLHNRASTDMASLYDYIKHTDQRLKRGENIKKLVENSSANSDVLQELASIMDVLKEIREKESGIEQEINPVLDMYNMLEQYVGDNTLDQEERDQKSVLRSKWNSLVDYAEKVTDELAELQETFKRKLLLDIKEFVHDVIVFRNDFLANGPMVMGIKPREAVDRLRRFHEEYEIHERKCNLYRSGEELFALASTDYPELTKTKKELLLLDILYNLYTEVIESVADWKQIEWVKIKDMIDTMEEKIEGFSKRCKRMPSKLREWVAYHALSEMIEQFQVVLPLLQQLSKLSVMQRHWTAVSLLCGTDFVIGPEFRLGTLLDSKIVDFADDVIDICDGADKQMTIQRKLGDIAELWQLYKFPFAKWKDTGVSVFTGLVPIVEDLEESEIQLQTMLTMKHVAPFREEAQGMLAKLSDTAETLDRWIKVQVLWCSLVGVFTAGDIAKNLPSEARKFLKVDKEFTVIMQKAEQTQDVVSCCAPDLVKISLEKFYMVLEECQNP